MPYIYIHTQHSHPHFTFKLCIFNTQGSNLLHSASPSAPPPLCNFTLHTLPPTQVEKTMTIAWWQMQKRGGALKSTTQGRTPPAASSSHWMVLLSTLCYSLRTSMTMREHREAVSVLTAFLRWGCVVGEWVCGVCVSCVHTCAWSQHMILMVIRGHSCTNIDPLPSLSLVLHLFSSLVTPPPSPCHPSSLPSSHQASLEELMEGSGGTALTVYDEAALCSSAFKYVHSRCNSSFSHKHYSTCINSGLQLWHTGHSIAQHHISQFSSWEDDRTVL